MVCTTSVLFSSSAKSWRKLLCLVYWNNHVICHWPSNSSTFTSLAMFQVQITLNWDTDIYIRQLTCIWALHMSTFTLGMSTFTLGIKKKKTQTKNSEYSILGTVPGYYGRIIKVIPMNLKKNSRSGFVFANSLAV